MPYISQVAIGKLKKLNVFGDDYNTCDGTGVRDYIHVVDLAKGHVSALKALNEPQFLTVNLGTGVGYSVLQVINTFEKCSGKRVPFQIVARRKGDIGTCYTNPTFAANKLNWSAEYGLEEMCADTWRWQSKNPNGYL